MKTLWVLTTAMIFTTAAQSFDQNTLIEFDAEGHVLYDSRVPMDRPCEVRWNAHTCKNVKVMELLVKHTPEYQEGHYARIEQVKQNRIAAQQSAERAHLDYLMELREREVRAAEQNALASTMNALKPAVQVNLH